MKGPEKVTLYSKIPNIVVIKANKGIKAKFNEKGIAVVDKKTADILVKDISKNYSLKKSSTSPAQSKKIWAEIQERIEKMSKDELLDYTAVHEIVADYKMSKAELIKIIEGN